MHPAVTHALTSVLQKIIVSPLQGYDAKCSINLTLRLRTNPLRG